MASAFVASKKVEDRQIHCQCEAKENDTREQGGDKLRLLVTKHHHYLQADLSKGCAMLASSSSSPVLVDANSHDRIGHSTQPTRQSWWTIRWQWLWSPAQKSHNRTGKNLSWWESIRQTFFVITRGIEIVARLSPLIVLTPTAMVVSYIDPIWKTIWKKVGKEENDLNALLTLDGLERNGDDLFTTQFRNSSTLNDHNYHYYQQSTTWVSNLSWRYTLHTLQSLGPAFVKLGQWAATRRDLFPVHVCNRLSELHDAARVHVYEHTDRALAEAFGEDYESRGLSFARGDDSILGSGSAAQVHKGTLTMPAKKSSKGNENNHLTTRTVAIKVLHPNTRQLVERDLALMQYTADFIDKYIPLQAVRMLSLPRAVSNFANVMERQVDLRIEGENLQIFRENFVGHKSSAFDVDDSYASYPPPTISFPRPEPDWISERVLVEEYAGGNAVPISRYLADDNPEGLKTRKKLAGPLLRAFLKMVFVDNFIHADLHPGNVLVRAVPNKSNPKRTNYTIIFLDAGIAVSLKPNDKKNLRDLFKAVVLNDGYTAGSLMVERARYERCTSIPGGKHAFASGVSDIVSEFHDRRKQGLTLGAVRVGALLGQVLDLCRRFGVEIDPAMSSVVVSMLVLEGLGRSLDPDLNLMKAAVPFLLGRGKV